MAGFMNRKEFLQSFLNEVWNGGDADAVDRYLAPEYTIFHDTGDPWEGRTLTPDQFKDRLVKSRSAAPDQVFHVQDMVEEGDRIAVTWLWKGTHLGDWPGLPATSKPISMSGVTVYHFTNDRLSGHWQIADRMAVYQQVMGGED